MSHANVWSAQAFAGLRLMVAGGCGGIGRHLVNQACSLGAQVAVLDLPSSIERHGGGMPRCIAMNATDAASVDAAVLQAASELGGIDACVNLVGFMSEPKALTQTSTAVWQEILHGNLDAAFSSPAPPCPICTSPSAAVCCTWPRAWAPGPDPISAPTVRPRPG